MNVVDGIAGSTTQREMTTSSVRADQLRASLSIFAVLTEIGYGVAVERTQQIRCPVHKDRHPSARVYADQNTLHCWTCGRTWDQVALVQAVHGYGLSEAVTWMESTFDVESPLLTLTSLVRQRLIRGRPATLDAMVTHVEQTIQDARPTLTARQFTKAFAAMDQIQHQLHETELGPQGATLAMERVLDYVRSR